MNMFEYVKKYGEYTFEEKKFNEVDNVILSQISYLTLDGIVFGFGHRPVSLSKTARLLEKQVNKKKTKIVAHFCKKIYKLLLEMKDTPRYRDVMLYNYIKVVDSYKQFGAVTLKLPDKSIYVSFEGTNSAISGWYEDARMTYSYPVPAQELAANYLRRTVRFIDRKVMVGGHSKGGNLAVYAALEAPLYLRKKIVKVFNNDGPGVPIHIFNTKRHRDLLPKIQKIVPNESVVGMFLYHSEDLTIIKSKRKRVLQHDSFNWMIDEVSFTRGDLSTFSKSVSFKTNEWLNRLSKEKRKQCVVEFFNAFDSSNIVETNQLLSISKSKEFVKNLYHINEESKENLIDVFKKIIW